jgi:hypothetical protein
MKYISFSKVLFVAIMGGAAFGHHYMWQNWDFLQNNPYMFIVTTIVMGIILFIGAGTIAAGVDSVAKKSSNNSLLPISVYSLIGVAIAVLGSVFAPVSMIYLIIGIILEIAIMLVGPISIIKGQGNKKEVE